MDILKFKEWLTNLDQPKIPLSDFEIANLYFHNQNMTVREIAERADVPIAELYRILKRYGSPNRQLPAHDSVMSFNHAGFPTKKIAEFTGYSPRNVRHILKKFRG